MRPNPPIPGHGLLSEGHCHLAIDPETDDYFPEGHPQRWTGGCVCGAKPDGWPHGSVGSVRRWHREHKAALRGEAPGALNGDRMAHALRVIYTQWDHDDEVYRAPHWARMAAARALDLPCCRCGNPRSAHDDEPTGDCYLYDPVDIPFEDPEPRA